MRRDWRPDTAQVEQEAAKVAATHRAWRKKGYADALSSSEIETLETYGEKRKAMTASQRAADDQLAVQRPVGPSDDVSWQHIQQTKARKAAGTLGDFYVQPRNIAVRSLFRQEDGTLNRYLFSRSYILPFITENQAAVFKLLVKEICPKGNLQLTKEEIAAGTKRPLKAVDQALTRLALAGIIGRWNTSVGAANTILATGIPAFDENPDCVRGCQALQDNGMLAKGVLKYDPFEGRNVWLESGKYAEFRHSPGTKVKSAKAKQRSGVRAASIWTAPVTVAADAPVDAEDAPRRQHAYDVEPAPRPRSGRATTATVDMSRAPGLTNQVTRILMRANGSFQEVRAAVKTSERTGTPMNLAPFLLRNISILDSLKNLGETGTSEAAQVTGQSRRIAVDVLLQDCARSVQGSTPKGRNSPLVAHMLSRARRESGFGQAVCRAMTVLRAPDLREVHAELAKTVCEEAPAY